MSARRFRVWNVASAALTAAPVFVTTGTTIKTMLQVKPAANLTIMAWGYVIDAATLSAKVTTELLSTGTINATVTAFNAGDVVKYDQAGGTAADLTLATSGSGFTSSGEGTITATRLLDVGPPWAVQYYTQFPLEREPGVVTADILRVRATTATAVNMLCYIDFEQK